MCIRSNDERTVPDLKAPAGWGKAEEQQRNNDFPISRRMHLYLSPSQMRIPA